VSGKLLILHSYYYTCLARCQGFSKEKIHKSNIYRQIDAAKKQEKRRALPREAFDTDRFSTIAGGRSGKH